MANRTTELEAVNYILAAMGESPLNSLDDSRADGRIAQDTLAEVSRDVQSRGWYFNTEFDVEFTPDSNSKVALSDNMLMVEVDHRQYNSIMPVQRGDYLYDTKNRRYTFTSKFKAKVVYLLEFTELPESARRYITITAARLYQQRYLTSQEINQDLEREELKAFVKLQAEEDKVWNRSLLDGVPRRNTNEYRRYYY